MENRILYAGFARVKVTPPMGNPVPGYYEKRFSDGFLTNLYLRATAFSDGQNKAVIFACDAIGMKADYFDILKKKIAHRCDMSEDAIYITCSHSHTSYRITVPGEDDADDNNIFLKRLYQQFCDCAQFAFEDLKPCTLKIAAGSAQKVGFIRRYRMKDGSCKTNPGIGNPDVVAPDAVQDESVQLIRVIREGGKEILLVNFGTHADVIGGCKYCYDWPGYLAEDLVGAFDGEVEAMTLVGCEGDSNHINVFRPKGSINKGVSVAKRMARILAGEVLKIYDDAKEVDGSRITFGYKIVQIGKNPYDPADIPEALEVREIYRKTGRQNPPELKEGGYKLNIPEAMRILANLERPEFFHLRVSALQLGNIAFIGFPGESFVSIGMDVKAGSKMDMTVTTCLTNGSEGYFPDKAAFAEKGYERSTSPFAHDCAKILSDAGLELVNGMEKL